MTVLLVFESIEGQTAKVVDYVREKVQDAGREAVVLNTADTASGPSFEGISGVILAAPVHERRHPPAFEAFIADHLDQLQARPTLILSVSLNAAFEDGRAEAQDYLTEMEMRTRFKPTAEVLVAGAVRSAGSYDFFQRQVLKYVVLREHDYDPADGPREFTDWDVLDSEISAFLERRSLSLA